MAALSWGIEAEMLGSLMMLASGRRRELTELGERVADALVLGRCSGKSGEDATGQRDVAGLDVDTGGRGEGLDDRQERVRGQHRGLVGEGVDDRWP
jgi:hypothetical protein